MLNLKSWQVHGTRGIHTKRLTELEGRFLKFLSENAKGSTKQELLSKVWGHNKLLDTHTLETSIYRLRKKIEVNPNEPKLLVLIEKKYFFIKN